MMNKFYGWGGLIALIAGIVLMVIAGNRDNDMFWENRSYTLLKKDQSEHIYKGQSKPDYFQRIQYDDEPLVTWTRTVDAITYFSQDVNGHYTERKGNERHENVIYFCMALWLAGIIMISMWFFNSFEI